MGMSKTEINLKRLLAAAPHQNNQAKLIHYIATLREQLEDLSEDRTPQGQRRISKGKVNDYSEKIEAIASKIAAKIEAIASKIAAPLPLQDAEDKSIPKSPVLRRRFVPTCQETSSDSDTIKLDSTAQAHIDKHRKLQDNLTDEMVGLAQRLKQTSLMISNSVQNTEKILDSTEEAVEHSLARTGHTNARAMTLHSESSKTSCFTCLLLFTMTCVFFMVVLLIRAT